MVARTQEQRRLSTVFDLMVAGTVAVTVLAALSNSSPGLSVVIGAGMAVLVAFRRRSPELIMAAVSLLALGQVLLRTQVPEFYDVAVLIAMYTVVKYTGHVLWAYAAGVAIAAAVWLTAYVLRTRRLYVQSLEERAATAERERDHLAQLAAADERAGIARELHDVVAHSLAVMIVQADGAAYSLEHNRELTRDALETIAATGRDALQDMRRIVGVLRGTTPADGDDGERRRIGLDQLDSLVERATSAGLRVDLRTVGEARGLAPADELTVFRLVQEALTNALRHAGYGAAVAVTLTFRPGAVTVEVTDDGAGNLVVVGGEGAPGRDGPVTRRLPGVASPTKQLPSPTKQLPGAEPRLPAAPAGGGHGLIGMRERVAVHGGTFEAGPRLGGGWQITAVVPVKGTP